MNLFYAALIRNSRYIFFAIPLLLVVSACNVNKHLKEGETWVSKNKVKVESEQKRKARKSLEYQLSTIIKQEPNEKFLGLFKTRLWYHYRTNDPGDTTKIDRWIRRKIAEPPAIYNEDITERTAKSMQYYLQNKGYFDAKVSYEVKKKKKNAVVTYTAVPQEVYTIDSVIFKCTDIKVQRILNDLEENSFLKKGDPVSGDLYSKEVERITSQMRNLGYAYFDQSYFDDLVGDSTGHQVNLQLEVFTPKDGSEHQVYHIGKIYIYPDYTPALLPINTIDTLIDGFHFINAPGKMIVKPQSISRAVYLREGDLYQLDNLNRTKLQLGNLEIYKSITIKPFLDSLDRGKLNFEIRLTPRKKMVVGADLEINNSNYSSTSDRTSILGTSANVNFKNRNFRRNASTFSTSLQGGLEFNFANSEDILYSLDLLAQSDWYIPKFMEFPKIWRGLNRLNLINDRFYSFLQEKGKSRISASYNRLLLFDFYNYHSFSGSFGYDLQSNQRTRYTLNQTGIDYFLPQALPPFQEILDENPLLANSFSEQLFTGFLFRDFGYEYSSRTNLFGKSWAILGNFELSGLEILGINSIYNAFSSDDITFQLFNKVDYAKYLRFSIDYRRYNQLGSNHSLAFRATSGIVTPFGGQEEAPYVKQFYGGGPNGIRAWSIRELGPGGYIDPITQSNDRTIPFYQSGTFKLELNAEYRFDIFSFFKGAIFVDAGNVWTLKEDTTRVGSQFLFKTKRDPSTGEVIGENFLRQIAVGSGFGIRGDFTYFIIRLDMGIKIRNPYPDATGRYTLFHTWDKLRLSDINYNLAIDYPF